MTAPMVTLRPARPADREEVYNWLLAAFQNPVFSPGEEPPTWRQFLDDYQELFWDQSQSRQGGLFIILVDGVAAGAVSYDARFTAPGACDVDIWMYGEEYCDQGYGSAGLKMLCQWLEERMDFRYLVMCPSAGNRRAVRAYQKSGFVFPDPSWAESADYSAGCDSADGVVMVRGLDRHLRGRMHGLTSEPAGDT